MPMPKVMGSAMKLMKLRRTPTRSIAASMKASASPSEPSTIATARGRRNSNVTVTPVSASDSNTDRGMSTSDARRRSAKITARPEPSTTRPSGRRIWRKASARRSR